jgi:tetratricopeptide (TPR) repeat protein
MMKKIFLVLTAVVMTAISVSAQDLATATETFNNGAMELQMGNMEAALTNFQSALEMAEALGEQGAEIATNCKGAIPQVMFSIAKGYIKEENFTGAIAQLDATIDAAKKYENADIAAEAAEFIPQVYMQQGNTALKAKDMATALAAYTKVVELEPTNGNALLRLGQVFAATGKVDEAVATFEQAAANGQEKTAFKQLSNIFLKKAQAAVKTKKYTEAIDFATKSNSYLESGNAYRMLASAYQQLNKPADCIASYEKYLELTPNAKDANGVKYTIAALAQTAGDKEKAKAYYQQIVTDPQYGATAQQMLQSL